MPCRAANPTEVHCKVLCNDAEIVQGVRNDLPQVWNAFECVVDCFPAIG